MNLDMSRGLFAGVHPSSPVPATRSKVPLQNKEVKKSSQVPSKEFQKSIETMQDDKGAVKHSSLKDSHKLNIEAPASRSTGVFQTVGRNKAVSQKIEMYQKKIDDLLKENQNLHAELKSTETDRRKEAINEQMNANFKEIEKLASAIKTLDVGAKVFIQFAQGKAKVVSADYHAMDWEAFKHDRTVKRKEGESEFKAYYTPTAPDKEAEIREEVDTGRAIGAKLMKLLESGKESFIAFKLDVMGKASQKGDQYTVATDAAKSDLDYLVNKKLMNKNFLKFPDSLGIAHNILEGMNNLHRAGFVHGDLKGDNVLIVQMGKKIIARLTDLGKTKEMGKNEVGIHVGNPRYAAPEGGISQKAEVYGTALLMIRALEGELLNSANGNMVINEKEFTKDPAASVGGKRTGIEKYLVLNKDCPQTENTTLRGKVTLLARETSRFFGIKNSYPNAQTAVHKYIDALIEGLSNKTDPPATDLQKAQLKELGALLKEMTRSNVDGTGETRTESLEVALQKYEKIMNRREPAPLPQGSAPPLPPRGPAS